MERYFSAIEKYIASNYKDYKINSRYKLNFGTLLYGVTISKGRFDYDQILIVINREGIVSALNGIIASSIYDTAERID